LEDFRAGWRTVPEVMINLLRSLHDGMEAEVTISSFTSPSFSVTNRLHQSCTIAPTLYALYLNQVIEIAVRLGSEGVL